MRENKMFTGSLAAIKVTVGDGEANVIHVHSSCVTHAYTEAEASAYFHGLAERKWLGYDAYYVVAEEVPETTRTYLDREGANDEP